MASHQLSDTYLADLARRLPPDVVAELADGFGETLRHHLNRGMSPAEAATATVADFGHPDQILAEFVRQSAGRRTALALLATGPVFAVLWGSSLITAHAWTWPVPPVTAVAFGAALLTVVGVLIAVITSPTYARTLLAAPACTAMIVLDTVMITVVLVVAPTFTWPMLLAIPASLTRIAATIPRLRQVRFT